MKSQDTKILMSLVNKEGVTAYALSQDTKISIPQVNYRLSKLVESNVVFISDIDNKTCYTIHPALKSNEIIQKIAELINKVVELINNVEYTKPDGIKVILELIISKLDINEQYEEYEENEEQISEKSVDTLIKEFKETIDAYAKEHNLKITNIPGWTTSKLTWMALNDRRCCCKPNDRICPCSEGLSEVMTSSDKMCLCSIFTR